MGVPQQTSAFGIDEFMAWEAGESERHEYLNGEVFAMTGARDAHNTIAGNIFTILRAALRGSPCRVFIADMKLRVDAADAVFYPDLLITCDPRDRGLDADTAKRHPTMLVEVLSDSTAAYDRGLKFERYRLIESLLEVLLVEQDRRHADLFRKQADGRWLLESFGPEGRLELASLGVGLELDTIYEDVAFDAPAG